MRFFFISLPLALIRLMFYLMVFLLPILGVWLASSLVAYINGPPLLAVFSGILLFPLIPILWDLKSRRQRKAGNLTWGDRITLRTLALNLVFLMLLLALRPQTSFLALSTRGDWFLEGLNSPQIELVRQGLFKLAGGLEGVYLAFRDNPFDQYADTTEIEPQPSAETQVPTPSALTTAGKAGEWPWPDSGLHPAVANMPASAETSIAAVAQYIASQETDPMQRVKALHDYVADRIAYDAPSYFAGRYPPQDAETVFRTRTAVCAGYAKLLEALGQAIGEEIVYVVGDARSSTSDLSGQSHAWNAAKVDGHWVLIDTTWDSGFTDRESGFTKQYRADYLFPPVEVMGITHFPEDMAWQLRPQPISRGAFLRQPMMRPQFFAEGLTLVAPTRSQTDTTSDAVVALQNPSQRWLLASYAPKGASQSENCSDSATQNAQISCSLPGAGTYEVRLFSGDEQYGEFAYLGQLEFNKR
jgi:hypothetical protein